MFAIEYIVSRYPFRINLTEISETHMDLWRLGHVEVFVWMEIRNTVPDIKVRIVFKMPDQIFVKYNPVFSVQDQAAKSDGVGYKLHVIVFCERAVFGVVLAPFANDFFNKMPRAFDPGAVRMQTRTVVLVFDVFL